MEQSKIISFIIPAYNSEKYLYKCLNSFLLNENTNSKMEVIIVNDGSTDGTEKIGNDFAKKYPQIFQVVSKKNGGHGSAVNEGTKKAKGLYLKVIDSDDWILTENLENYISALESISADVVLTPYFFYNIQTHSLQPCSYSDKNIPSKLTLNDVCEKWTDVKELFTIHGITYRTEFYRQNSKTLPEHIFYDDQIYTTVPCCYSKCIYYCPIFLYIYRIGDSSQSVSEKNQAIRNTHLKKIILSMSQDYKQHKEQFLEYEGEFYLEKMKIVLLSYYRVTCLLLSDRRQGRKKAKHMNAYMKQLIPELWQSTKMKYNIFVFLSLLHFSSRQYQYVLNSIIYRHIKKYQNS